MNTDSELPDQIDDTEMRLRAAALENARLRETNATLTARVAELEATVSATLTWAESRCPCNEETPDPCTLCGATVETGVCMSAENTIPKVILKTLRSAAALTQGESNG